MKPFEYLGTAEGLVWAGICIALAALFTALVFVIMNNIPARWLCDYNEEPSKELLSGKRIRSLPAAPVLFIVFSAVLLLCRVQFNTGFDPVFIMMSAVVLCAVLIAVSDLKYQIIPDQFTIALAVLAVALSIYDIICGYGFFHRAWWSTLAGAAIGAGVMILIDLIGQFIYHKEGMGFGDVKLFAAVGLLAGFPGTVYVLVISILTATVGFVAVLIVRAVRQPKEQSAETVGAKESAEAEEKQSEGTETEEKQHDGAETEEKQTDGEEQAKNEEEDAPAGGAYLAFGPYIAAALILYLALYDRILDLVNMYLDLFR